MAAHVVAEPRSNSHSAIASYWHTAFILLVAGVLAYRGMVRAGQVRALVNPDRFSIYTRTIFFEWLVLGLVLAGVWLHGSSIWTVLGERWRSIKQFLLDIAIGVAFMMVSVPAASLLGSLLPGGGNEKASQFILPQGRTELVLWVALSISAGICEEAVYRGYFLRQFTALTKSTPAGIVLAGVLFGAAHSYLGLSQAIQIAFLGTMTGILATWRRTVRPGMIAHTVQDILGAVFRH
jgi:membrane protease YdiL (CAAX protease family)